MALVQILTDGGGTHGFGNLRRCATLAEAFKSAGHHVRVEAVSGDARRLLPACPHDDGDATISLLDLPYNGDDVVKAERAMGRKVAALDFEGAESPDLVISVFPRGTAPNAANHRVGLDYVIIRPDIAAIAPAPPGRGVLVVMGGGDADGLGEGAAASLHEQGCAVTLIDGPLAMPSRTLPGAVQRLHNPADLARCMAGCSWAVTSGGGAMMEMLCLGKAVYVLPRTRFERALAQRIADEGALLGIGPESLLPPSDADRTAKGAAGTRLVDGRGAHRIVDAVMELA